VTQVASPDQFIRERGKDGIEIEHLSLPLKQMESRGGLAVDQIAKLVGEVAGREAKAIGAEKTVDAKIEVRLRSGRNAGLPGLQDRGKGFENSGVPHALAVRNSSASVSPGVLRTAGERRWRTRGTNRAQNLWLASARAPALR